MQINSSPRYLIVSGVSGVGKSTLLSRLFELCPDLYRVVGITTRTLRPGEQEGVHLRFVSRENFYELSMSGKLAASNSPFGDAFYGVEFEKLESVPQDKIPVVEVDYAKLKQLQRYYDTVSILLITPSIEAMKDRLINRGIHTCDDVQNRIIRGKEILVNADIYDYLIDTEDINISLSNLLAIVQLERLRRNRHLILQSIKTQIENINLVSSI